MVFTSVGVHPNYTADHSVSCEQLIDYAQHQSCIAIGETGLDFLRTGDIPYQNKQCDSFATHIHAGIASNKPLIIHTRAAAEKTLDIMRSERADTIGGVMHCFAEDWEIAKKALDLNFYISFSGIVTFKNAHVLQAVAKKVPADRYLIETDSPYLAPTPLRGQQNHPALVAHVAKQLSTLRNVDYATIAEESTHNFYQCFKLEALSKP